MNWKTILNKLKIFFGKLTFNQIVFIAAIVLALLFFKQCGTISNLKQDLNNEKQNTEALSDSIVKYQDKSGTWSYEKGVLVADKKRLKELNKELYDEVEKEKGKVLMLSSALANINNKPGDTIYIDNEVIKYMDGMYGLKWELDTTYNSTSKRVLAGESKFNVSKSGAITSFGTKLFKDETYFKLVTGLKEQKDGTLKIFVKSDFPGFNITDLEGAIVDPKEFSSTSKKKHWTFGPNVSIGFDSDLNKSIYLGIGVQYSIIRF